MQQCNTDRERVAFLIDSYREEIGGANSKNAKAIQEFDDAEEKKQYAAIEEIIAKGEDVPKFEVVIEHPIEMEYKIKTNEQLLGHFYSKVAGNDADKDVLLQLLPDYYDATFFTDEEEAFLTVHFKDVVNHIITTSYLIFQEYNDLKEVHLLSPELLNLVASVFQVPEGAVVYNPFAGLAQFTSAFDNCTFICEESFTKGQKRNIKSDANWLWAWMKVALFANNRNAKVIEDDVIPSLYDYAVTYIPYTSTVFFTNPNDETLQNILKNDCDETIVSKLQLTYQHLSSDGKILLIIPEFLLWEAGNNYPMRDLWERVVDDGALAKIIQLPSTCNGLNYNFCILIIDKGHQTHDVLMIDARFAAKTTDLRIIELEDYLDVIRDNRYNYSDENHPSGYRNVYIDGEEKMAEEYDVPFSQTINLDLFDAMLRNNGKEPNTGLRKMATISQRNLDIHLLLPQVYVLEKPHTEENTIPLSELCSFESTLIRDLEYNLPMDTPWIKVNNLTSLYQGHLDFDEAEKAECLNNPPHTSDYSFDSNGKFSEKYPWYQRKPIGRRILEYRKCTCLDGHKDAVLITYYSVGNPFAICDKGEKPIAIGKGIMAFYPKDGVQLITLAAVLKMPIVYNQILAYTKFGLSEHLNNIRIPFDKWLIDNEVDRLIHEEETINHFKTERDNIRKSVRMRKHALTQSFSSLQAMFNALNAYRIRKGGHIIDKEVISRIKGTKVYEAFDYISKNLKDMMPVLEHIADVDYSFAEPVWVDPEAFVDTYISKNEKGWINFSTTTTWDKGNNKAPKDMIDPSSGAILFKRGEVLNQFLFPEDALEKVLDNIVSNAKSHGFDGNRSDYQIRFSWFSEDKTIKLLIENNGTPIPDDRDPASLLEYGVSTVLHTDGHNGIGCNEIDDIMRRYDGKVEIKSSPKEEFTVKYLLTFFRSNSVY